MKKILLILSALFIANVVHAYDFEVDGLRYNIINESQHEVEVAKPSNSSITEADIPSSVTYNGSRYEVVSIGDDAFDNCRSLTSVAIPNSVTNIGTKAFKNCRSLTSVIIPNSVTSIGELVFGLCTSLTSVTIPNSVTSIGESAFYSCAFTSVSIPNSVTNIGACAFHSCTNLVSVTIPVSVVNIGIGPFSYCERLTNIIVDEGNKYYTSDNGVLYNKDKTVIIQCPGAKKEYEILTSVTNIGNSAFLGCRNLTSVTIPNSVTSIGVCAFSVCSSLTSVSIPSSVKTIDEYAFLSCTKIQEIYSANPEPPTCQSDTFYDVPTDATVYVPYGSIPDYSTSEGWSGFFNFVETDNFPNAVEGIFEDTESGSKNVYNIQGVCVKRDATQSDIDALPSGLYIIGGKKVVIK